MAEVVSATEIERIVKARRGILHKGRVMTTLGPDGRMPSTIFVLHSISCFDEGRGDLMACAYTGAMENGQDERFWNGWLDDEPFILRIYVDRDGIERLIPMARCAQ